MNGARAVLEKGQRNTESELSVWEKVAARISEAAKFQEAPARSREQMTNTFKSADTL